MIIRSAVWIVLLVSSLCVSTGQVRLGLIGDQTGTDDWERSYRTLQDGIEFFKARKLAYHAFLHLGDLLESSRSEDRIREDFKRAAGLLDRLPSPWYLTPGDHDVNPPGFEPASKDDSRRRLLADLYSRRRPRIGSELHYSFDIADVHIVALDSLERLHSDPRWGNVFLSRISERQYEWLASDLAAVPRTSVVVVFTHHPLWYEWGGWQRVHELLARHRTVAVVAGHFHYPQQGAKLDGIQYLTIGATGGMTKQGTPEAGGLQAVYSLLVDEGRVSWEVHPLDGNRLGELPLRADMDRVQAIDATLDQLSFSMAAENKLRLVDGSLRADCHEGGPPEIVVRHVGNPIEEPLEFQVTPETSGLSLDSQWFSSEACLTVTEEVCRIRPGFNVALSNASLTQLSRIDLKPIWKAYPVFSAGHLAPEKVDLMIRLAFRDSAGRRPVLWRRISLPVTPCP